MKIFESLSVQSVLKSITVSIIVTLLVWCPIIYNLLLREARGTSQFVEEDTLVLVTKLQSGVSVGYETYEMFNDNGNLFNMYQATKGDKISLTTETKEAKETIATMYKEGTNDKLNWIQEVVLHRIVNREKDFFNDKITVQPGIEIEKVKDGKESIPVLKVSSTFQYNGHTYTITVERNMERIFSRFLGFEFKGLEKIFCGVLITTVISASILLNFTTRSIKKTLTKQSKLVAISHGGAPNLAVGNGHHFKEACEVYIDLGRRLDEAHERSINSLEDVSHSVASRLTEIKQSIDLIRYYGYEDKEAVEVQMKRIEDNSNRIREIHSTISSLAKLERSKMSASPQVFALRELINLATDVAMRQYPDFEIEHPIIDCCHKNIFIQREHFLLIVEALIQNAVKYSTGDNKKIVIQCMDEETSKNEVGFSITNWGIGVPIGEESRIFERYYRGSNTIYAKNGIGLGLHMVYKILQLYEADIKVESVLEHNAYKTTFIIIFPKIKED